MTDIHNDNTRRLVEVRQKLSQAIEKKNYLNQEIDHCNSEINQVHSQVLNTKAELEHELDSLKKKDLPTEQIEKEVFAQYPQHVSISITRGSKAEVKNAGKTPSIQKLKNEQISAFVKFSSPLSEKEIESLQAWLSVRLEIPTIKIIEEK